MDSTKDIKVSVIIPIYNQEKYLWECMESVLLQNLQEIEVICVNDGSTDGSFDILSDLSWSDDRILIINQENKGVGEARNRGIREARGEFLAFIDPDDRYYNFKALETLYNKAKENNALISGGCFTIQREEYGEKTEFAGNEAGYTFTEDRMYSYREYQYDYGFHRFIYDRKMVAENRLFFTSLKRFQDSLWFVQVMHKAVTFFGVSDTIYSYKSDHKENDFDKEKVADNVKGITEVAAFAKKNEYDNLLNLERMRLIRGTAEEIYPYLSKGDKDIKELLCLFEETSGFDNTEKDILINIINNRDRHLAACIEELERMKKNTSELRIENGAFKRTIDSQQSELELINENIEALFKEVGLRLKKSDKITGNVLPYPYVHMEQDADGIKWTVLEDGRIEANGTAEKDTQFSLTKPLTKTDFKTGNKRYRITTGAPNTSSFTWFISGMICNKESGDNCLLRNAAVNDTEGFSESFEIDTSGYDYFGRLYIAVKKGRTLDHVIFRPEICQID